MFGEGRRGKIVLCLNRDSKSLINEETQITVSGGKKTELVCFTWSSLTRICPSVSEASGTEGQSFFPHPGGSPENEAAHAQRNSGGDAGWKKQLLLEPRLPPAAAAALPTTQPLKAQRRCPRRTDETLHTCSCTHGESCPKPQKPSQTWGPWDPETLSSAIWQRGDRARSHKGWALVPVLVSLWPLNQAWDQSLEQDGHCCVMSMPGNGNTGPN